MTMFSLRSAINERNPSGTTSTGLEFQRWAESQGHDLRKVAAFLKAARGEHYNLDQMKLAYARQIAR